MISSLKALVLAAVAAITVSALPAVASADTSEEDFVYVTMKTNKGDIVLELDRELAPITADNFMSYVDKDFYDGLVFHRIVPGFVIQGGGFDAQSKQKATDAGIKNEWDNGLTNDRGTIAMARGGAPDSATSQFYINLKDNAMLDVPRSARGAEDPNGAAYCVFGRVVDGMDVVDAIAAVETAPNPQIGNMPAPVTPIVIESVDRVTGEKLDTLEKDNKDERQAVLDKAEEHRAELKQKLADVNKSDEERRADGIKMLEGKGYKIDPSKGVVTSSGLWYYDLEEGTGTTPSSPSAAVTVDYTGWFTDGKQFDSSRGKQPVTLALNRFIPGWSEGVSTMKTGGKRLMIIPGKIAYGPQGRPGIPPNATLCFEVELVDTK